MSDRWMREMDIEEICQHLDELADRIRDLGGLSKTEFTNLHGSALNLQNSVTYSQGATADARA